MERNLRKTRVGIVTSDKMDKTVVVSVKAGLSILFIRRSSTTHTSSRLTMKRMSAAWATVCSLWKPVPFQRIRDGV